MRAGGKFAAGSGWREETILVETGNGTKWDPKLRNIYGIAEGDPLTDSLAQRGSEAGRRSIWSSTRICISIIAAEIRDWWMAATFLLFRTRKYVVQRAELDHAMHPSERDRASYFDDRFVPISEAGRWQFVEGDVRDRCRGFRWCGFRGTTRIFRG